MKKTLLIMAAGLASRYGGGKQIEKIGPNGEMLMEYSINDARKNGFDKVVFIIAPSMSSDFPKLIESKVSDIKIEYAIQSFDSLPNGFCPPAGRIKPYGTVHAVISARDYLDTPFAVLNADDFYGEQAFKDMSEMLDKTDDEQAVMVSYPLGKTLSMSGQVTRGICEINEDNQLISVCETYRIEMDSDGDIKSYEDDGSVKILARDLPASMNFWGFYPSFINKCEECFAGFLASLSDDEMSKEYPLPVMIDKCIKSNMIKVLVRKTDSEWMGITYREDRQIVADRLAKKID